MSLISPTVLIKRLNSLAGPGLVHQKGTSGQQGDEYSPTEYRKQLLWITNSSGLKDVTQAWRINDDTVPVITGSQPTK